MLKSYVGIATPNGLEAFLPEHERAVRTLSELARNRRAVCYWAVLPEEAALEVEEQLELGDTLAALRTLDRSAAHAGAIP